MRKFLLLCLGLVISFSATSQKDTVFFETFDNPSGADSVTSGYAGGIPLAWNTSSTVFSSPNQSYNAALPVGVGAGSVVYFETDPFSTVGKPFVWLSFDNIAKIDLVHQAFVYISTNGGSSWSLVGPQQYKGADKNFQFSGWFNAGSHIQGAANIGPWQRLQVSATPTNSWWRNEPFDLTGLASDTANMTGYADVRLRFELVINQTIQQQQAGWFIDDLLVTAGSCEVTPPEIDLTYNPIPCYPVNPQGPLVADIVDSTYTFGLTASDARNKFDQGIDSVVVYYRVDGGPLEWRTLPGTPNYYDSKREYMDSTFKFTEGDTVEYFFKAWDLGCPNETQIPPPYVNGGFFEFWIEFDLPTKCGNSVCDKYPEVIKIDSTDWVEDFDDASRWMPGGGGGAAGNGHRGTFPVYPEGAWVVAPPPNAANFSEIGWSINTGPTPSALTGPDYDHTLGQGGGGQYIYYEFPASSSVNFKPSALRTPCIDLTSSTTCKAMEFYYHMFGEDVYRLYVAIDTGADGAAWINNYKVIEGQQQGSSTDPWKRAIIPLDDYNGQIIRIAFLAVTDNSQPGKPTKADIAIDDLRIYEPVPVDFEILGSSYPVNGYCAYGMEDVLVSVRNNGCITGTNIPLAFQVNNGPIKRDTITNADLILGEDTTNFVFGPKADLTGGGIFNIKIWVEDPLDVDLSNDTLFKDTIEYYPAIDQFPYVIDFEDADPVTNDLNNNQIRYMDGLDPMFRWQVGTEMTEIANIGPYSGHGNEGNYLFVESNFSDQDVSTSLRTICVNLNLLNNPHLDFLYHNNTNPAHFDNLIIEVSKELEDLDTWTPIPGSAISSTAGFNNEYSDWKLKRIDLGAAGYAGAIKIRFRANRNAVSGDEVNFAIDNIVIYDPLTQDGGVFNIQTPDMDKAGTRDANGVVPQVSVVNYGTNVLNNFDVNLQITPLCGPNAGQSTVYTQSYTAENIAAEQNKVVTMDNININWPETECRMCFYTSVAGDSYAFNDTVCKNFTVQTTHNIVEQFPNDTTFFNDYFDECNYSRTTFFADGGWLQWQLGQPTFGASAKTNPNAWATNLDGPFTVGTTEYLYLPEISNLDTIVGAELSFQHQFNFGGATGPGEYDVAGTLQYLNPQNQQWEVLGSGSNLSFSVTDVSRGTINWWFSQYGSLEVDLFGGQPGWKGTTGNKYIASGYDMGQFNRDTNDLELRFVFSSKPTMSQASASFGWAIDNWSFYVPPQNSVGPVVRGTHTLKTVPFPGVAQNLRIRIVNSGAKVVDSVLVDVYVDGNHLGTHKEVFDNSGSRPFTNQAVRTIMYEHDWPANLVTPGPHEVCVITSRPNGKHDNFTPDDTLCMNIPVLEEYDLTSIGDSSFCNDFEGTVAGQYRWITAPIEKYSTAPSSWNDGASLQFPTAHSGNVMWMTDLYENYDNLDNSALYTPLFNVDSGQTYKIDFWHQFQTEKYHDGGNIEMSFDGGENWYHLGHAINGKDNWYNTPFVTALDQIKDGWTDSSGGWVNAWQRISFKDDVDVVFRFRFASDYSIEYPGWAIDDFCFYKLSGPTDIPEIGSEEFIRPDDITIGELAPNPANDKTELVFNFPSPNHMSVKVYNVIGQLVEDHSNEKYQEGIHKLSFNTSSWKNGVYLINIEYDEGKVVTKKLVVSH